MLPIALFNVPLIEDGDLSDDITSDSQYIGEARTIAAQFVWSDGSSPVGVCSLQCSNNNVDFDDVGTASISGTSGIASINFDAPGFFYARLAFVSTSGTGTLNASLAAKS